MTPQRYRIYEEDLTIIMSGSEAGLLVAVIDDDRASRWGLSLVLQDWGYRVVTGHSAEALLRKLETAEQPLHALITDFHLTRMTGVEAAARIRDHMGAQVPVIIITGTGGRTAGKRAAKHDYPVWTKPVDPDRLRKWLAGLGHGQESREPGARSAAEYPQAEK